MSKKWMTFLVVAVIGALLLPSAAFATCGASILGNLAVHDKTAKGGAGAVVIDPASYTGGDAIDLISYGTYGPVATGALINAEGQAERLSDLLIYENTGTASGAAGFCFNAGTVITITFNGVLTSPAVGTSLSTVNNMDLYDVTGTLGLSVTGSTVGQAFSANTTQTIITITIGQSGSGAAASPIMFNAGGVPNTAAQGGSALRVKNLRIDATSVTGGAAVTVAISQTQGGATNAVPTVVGYPALAVAGTTVATKVITNASTIQPVVGGVTKVAAVTVGGVQANGTQSSGKGLTGGSQLIAFTPGFATAYRLAGSCQGGLATCPSVVSNDIATGNTSLALSLSGIPSGVTVTFPAKLDFTQIAGQALIGMVFNNRSGSTTSNSGAPGTLSAIYDLNKNGNSLATVNIETADIADSGTAVGASAATNLNPNCGGTPLAGINNGPAVCTADPKIGVIVGATSGSGTATLSMAFGPTDTANSLFTGDDSATSGLIPRYLGSGAPTAPAAAGALTANAVATRYIVKSAPFFTINPVRTTLLFPFVSTVGGFNSGISIVNTTSDTGVGFTAGAATKAKGAVAFYLFGVDPKTGAAVTGTLNTDLTAGGTAVTGACRGFDASGFVATGTGAACAISTIIPIATWAGGTAPSGFDGYIIAVTSFNNAHGFSAQFDATGSPFGANPALVLGGGTTRNGGGPESLGN